MSQRILVVVCLLLVACSGKKNETSNHISNHEAHECLFRLQALFTDAEEDFSFPLWFNEKILSRQKISAITRRMYSIPLKGDERQLREKRQYYFQRNGVLRCLVIRQYFDEEEIGLVRYDYPNGHDVHGFGKFNVVKDTSRLNAYQDQNIPEVKHRFSLAFKGADFLMYRDRNTGKKRFYFPSRKGQKNDSIPAPQTYDEVIIGSAFTPTSRYSLGHNEIKSEFVRYVYSKKTGAIQRILFYQGPMICKRTFAYNVNGKCTGFVDATFHGAKCLTNFTTEFILNGKGNPMKVNTFKITNEKPTLLQSEQFHYEHF